MNMPVQTDNIHQASESSGITDGTTQFIVENVAVEAQLPLSISRQIANSYFPNDVSTVIAYLNKPVPVISGTWTNGGSPGSLLVNQDTWVGVWNNTMWKEKLHGFYGLRATLRVDLVLNCNPFQSGRLRLCYYPAASINPIKVDCHIKHRVPLSQLPGVDIGCGDQSVSLSIPYVTPFRFIELTSSIVSWGNLYLAVMSVLGTGVAGSANADYTIWYSMQDVELFGQTNKAVSQQSGTGKSKPKKICPSEGELKPISHILGAAADFTDSVGKIPLLSPWTGPVSWFLNAAKGAAMAFGFSKPIACEQPCRMTSNYNWHTTTSDGVDNSMPLAVLHDAKLQILDDVNDSEEDQMSIAFIKRQWAFYNTFTINTTDALGAQLYRLPLQPNTFNINNGANDVYHTPLSYLSNLFCSYRGGVEVMFKLVKTGFHAGSLAISYVPGPSDSTLSITDTSYVYRTVIDIQEGDHMCFRVPYLLPFDFMDTSIGFGSLYVTVVNPLRCPETCMSTVEVLVYVRGAESFQVQRPYPWGNEVVTQQGGDTSEISEDIVCSAPGDAPVAPLNLQFCQESMSETVLSLLQLLKRFNPISIEWLNPTDDIIVLYPWAVGCGRYFASTYTVGRQLRDPVYNVILGPFAFYRGGMRYRVNPPASVSDSAVMYMWRTDAPSYGAPFVRTSDSTAPSDPWVTTAYTTSFPHFQTLPMAANQSNFGGLSCLVPYQGNNRFAPVQYANTASSSGDFHTPRPLLNIWTGPARTRLLSRAVADDFQALFWVGIPRMKF